MPRLNNHERNQAIGMLNAGMSATVVSRHFRCTRKTIERLGTRFRVKGNVADRPQSGGPRVTTAANDRYIVLQHLRNRRLTTAETGRQYGIHPQTVRNRFRKMFKLFVLTDQILTRRHRTARRDWCTSDVPIGFSDECWFDLPIPTDALEFFAVGESVLPMRR